jgi:protein-glucosylgalactosylhydroxylysine glucosidase
MLRVTFISICVLFAVFCISYVVAFREAGYIPEEWQQQIANFDAFYSENDDGEMNSEGYPGIYLPLMGNGYFSHSKGVRSDTYYIAGVYNLETTTPSIRARIPATLAIQVNNSKTTGTLLDIRNGTYYRRGMLSNYPGAWYELRWYAHMERRNLYVMEMQVFSKGTEVTLNLINNCGAPSEDIVFQKKSFKSYEVTCGNTTIPETTDVPTTRVCLASSTVPEVLIVPARDSGRTHTFFTVVRTSLDSASPDTDVLINYETTLLAAKRSSQLSFQPQAQSTLLQEHIAAWSKLWNSGIELTGNRPDAAIAINASLFAILSSVRDDWEYGLAPGGLTNYYSGHSFWDTETWMYPALLLLHPNTARSLIAYRFNRLDGAYAKAKTYSPPYAGAMFPWESAFTGQETCPLWADTGLREQHISADIALAVWQYWLVTLDVAWLRSVAYPILSGVADFFVSRVTLNQTDDGHLVAHIYDVIPPDEYVSHGNDSVYTNFAAASALRFAVDAASILGYPVNRTYSDVADALVILFDADLNIHPEYKEYTGEVIKQADVVLLHYPWGMEMTEDVRKSDLDYYAQRSDENGPAMTWGMHSIGFKDLQLLDEAAVFFNRSFQDNTHAPFNVWSETPSGNAGNFITGAGGFLQTLVHGYAGLRVQTAQLLIGNPICPENADFLRVRGVNYLGSRFSVGYKCCQESSSPCKSMAVSLSVEVLDVGGVPLQLVSLDPTSGDVLNTYGPMLAGQNIEVQVPCVASRGVPVGSAFAVQELK